MTRSLISLMLTWMERILIFGCNVHKKNASLHEISQSITQQFDMQWTGSPLYQIMQNGHQIMPLTLHLSV